MHLYELTESYRKVQTYLEQIDEEGEAAQQGLELLEQLEDNIEAKLCGIARVVKNLTADAEAIKAEEKRLSERRRATENNVQRLKEYAQRQMQMAQMQKAKDELFTLSIQKNPPSVRITDESTIPAPYRIPQPDKIDKRALLDELKAGAEIEGAELEQTEGLRIR
jgi:chromosome segregation ATPase